MEIFKDRNVWEQDLADHMLNIVKEEIPILPEGTKVSDYTPQNRHHYPLTYLMKDGWNEVFKVSLKFPNSKTKLHTDPIYIPVVDMKLPVPEFYPGEELFYKREYGIRKKGTVKYVRAYFKEKENNWKLEYQLSNNGHDTIVSEDVLRGKEE